MKKFLVVLSLLLVAISLQAQVRTGNIYGKITDSEGNPLPGVSVTLKGSKMAPLTTVTSGTGLYRFVSLGPADDYEITAELTGFKKETKTGVIVTLGANVEINLTMSVGTLEEQVTVVAQTPVVDVKKTTVGQNVTKEAMQSLPSARDPWVVMQLAPAIMLDRENVGGNESGQQASFLAKGDMSNNGYVGSDNIWAVDGIDITDPAALGGSALYYDFDMFEELNITTGGAADVSVQTGGIALNMVTRRGGNKMSLAGRFYLTDNYFQSNNLTADLKAKGVNNINKIQQIKDYGFNAGGPVIKDKLWWWGAYGVQDIFVYTMYATKDQTLLNNYNLKLNAQVLANNRFEALITSGAKEKLGRNASVAKPEGDHQQGKYHWGSPIIKLQDEHVFGNNLYLSLKYSFNDAGFKWVPMVDEGLQFPVVYDRTSTKYVAYGYGATAASWGGYYASRPRNNYQLNANYFNDTFLGLSHEIKLGLEYSHKIAAHQWGNFQGFDINKNYNTAALDTDHSGARTAAEMVGSGWQRISWYRDGRDNGIADQYAAYIQDTIVKGRFTVTLGLRYDKQMGSNGAVTYGAGPDTYKSWTAWQTVFGAPDGDVNTALAAILPPVTSVTVKGNPQILSGSPRAYQWNTWSPRIGITYDITGDGKTVAKLALSQYGDIMGTGTGAGVPLGTGGGGGFWWMDGGYGETAPGVWGKLGAADGKVQLSELFWAYSSVNPAGVRYVPYAVFDGTSINAATLADLTANGFDSDPYLSGNLYGFDWNNKTGLDYSQITWWVDKKSTQSSTRTREILATLEREIIPDLSASVTASYRRYDNFDYGLTYYPASKGYDYTDPRGLDLTNLIINPTTPSALGPWYVEVGTQPSEITVTYPKNPDGTPVYPWAGGGDVKFATHGGPFYLPAAYWPETGTPYSVTVKSDRWTNYMGIDFVLNKRLSNKWFANASVTLQNQKSYWGKFWFDETDKWAYDGQPFGQWGGGASGKQSVLMYTRWMAKLSGLYQLPWGFDLSGTFNAREGWKIPHYYYLEVDPATVPNSNAFALWPTIQKDIVDSLPTFWNITLRLEKKIQVGQGRLYLMGDVFNLFNSAIVNRAYDAFPGYTYWTGVTGNPAETQIDSGYNATYRRLNEILNPRIWRFGARFEF